MKLLLADQVAVMLQIPKGRIYELARQGVIPSARIGRSVRFDEDVLRLWIGRGGSSLLEATHKAADVAAAKAPAASSIRRR